VAGPRSPCVRPERAHTRAVFSSRSAFPRHRNELSSALSRLRHAGGELFDLTQSNPTRCELPYANEVYAAAFADAVALPYAPEPAGLASARRAVAEELSPRAPGLSPRQVVLTSSTSEAYGFAFKLLCDAGDEILVPRPSYPLLEYLAELDGVRLVSYRLAYDGAWHVDFESVLAARTPRTRAVVAVHPNNPTGSFLKRAELARFSELGLPLISDEVFADYPLSADASRAPSAFGAPGVLSVTLGGLSKCVGLPQHKLAWMCLSGPPGVLEEALERLEIIADTYLSPSIAVQAALPALFEAGAATRAAIRARCAANLRCLSEALRDGAATALRVEGGWYAVIRLPAVRAEDTWVLELAERDRVVVEPGWFYDFEDGPMAVVCLLGPERAFAAGAARLAEGVARAVR